MDPSPLNVLSLFSGVGGLDLGLRMAVPTARVCCFVEREAFACEVLASRMEDGWVDEAPVWTDIETFRGRRWRGAVDCIAGGFPCQDISNAGKRAGLEGSRSGLWREYARIIREVGPWLVFVENVSALVVRGLDRVIGDLATLGFDAEWGCYRASEVGASHRRERIFILAYARCLRECGLQPESFGWCSDPSAPGSPRSAANPDIDGLEGQRRSGVLHRERTTRRNDAHGRGRPGEMGDPDLQGLEGRRMRERERPHERAPWAPSRTLAHSTRDRREQRWTESEGKLRGPHAPFCCVPFPPGPSDAERWRDYLGQWPGLEPSVRRGTDGLAHRVDQLRLLGNAVVPMQAAYAFCDLWTRAVNRDPRGAR